MSSWEARPDWIRARSRSESTRAAAKAVSAFGRSMGWALIVSAAAWRTELTVADKTPEAAIAAGSRPARIRVHGKSAGTRKPEGGASVFETARAASLPEPRAVPLATRDVDPLFGEPVDVCAAPR